MLSSRILQVSSATLRPRLQLSATSSGSSWGRIRRFSQVPPSTPPPPAPKPPTSSTSAAESQSSLSQMWAKFVGPKVMPERYTFAWYREMVLICTVFAITGSSTMLLVRPAVKQGLGLEGSFREGPWSFRICSIVVMTPIYASLLVVVGTVFGRHHYFRHFSVKMWSRFGIPPEMIDASYHQTKKTFKKW